MKKYLSELHQKSDRQKKHFALLLALTITLLIASFWSLVSFGVGGTLASRLEREEKVSKTEEVGPLGALYSNLSSSISGLKSGALELKDGFKVIIPSSREELPENALELYGR